MEANLSSHVNLPFRWVFFYEGLHQLVAFSIIEDNYLDASGFEVLFPAHECPILTVKMLVDSLNKTSKITHPITTRFTLNNRQAPVHISQGERVVYIVDPLYAEAGKRPAFSSAEVSPYAFHQLDTMYVWRCSRLSHMKRSTAFLNAHIMAPTKNLPIDSDESCADRYPPFRRTLPRFFERSLKTNITLHLVAIP